MLGTLVDACVGVRILLAYLLEGCTIVYVPDKMP
jgi:hypothetical protein